MKSSDKIVSVKTLKTKLRFHRRQGKRIAFTNGCFDILHLGHVTYLEKSKGHDRILVIGLNSDASVRRIKGANRPINSQKARSRILAALSCVDYVTIFNENTPLKLIKEITPDILIKGADWKDKEIIGAGHVQKNGGRVQLIDYVANYSTTNILKSL